MSPLVVAFLVLTLAIPNDGAKTCEQGELCTSEHDADANLNLLQMGLSVKTGNHPQETSLSPLPSSPHRENDGAMQCGPDNNASVIEYSRKLCQDTAHFSDTLLVIHFNERPRVGVVPFLLKRYSQCFRHISVVAPGHPPDCPQFPILKCDDTGWYTQKCYAAAMVANPGFRSYFVMNDDSPFIPERFMSYDRDRWWSMQCPHWYKSDLLFTEHIPENFLEGMDRHQTDGYKGLVSWFNKTATEQMKGQYIAYMKGAYIPKKCVQELVHIPKTMVPFYLKLAEEMTHEHLELFQAMTNHLWAALGNPEENIPESEFLFDWQRDGKPGHARKAFQALNDTHAAMVHPLKLSDPTIWATVDDWLFQSHL